ncbi:MAG TPA: hypothetical protein VFI47_24635, partial [Acidimicrobiales bacterium]|nr:hypothetical protein [Acidimicrobiales bacterium]
MGRVAAALAGACIVAVAVCPADRTDGARAAAATAPSESAGAEEPVHGLHAVVRRSSLFEPIRALALDVSYDGDDGVDVAAMQLSTPLFEPVVPGD